MSAICAKITTISNELFESEVKESLEKESERMIGKESCEERILL